MLFDIRDKEEEKRIMESKEIQASLKQIRKWSADFIVPDRFVRLKVEGLPAYARNANNFIKVGSLWGEVVVTDPCSEEWQDWSCGIICVKTMVMEE